MKYVVFFVIWISACALQDYVINIESSAYIMLYGYMVGLLAHGVFGTWPIKTPATGEINGVKS